MSETPVLSGGIFFTLLLEARPQRTAKRENAEGASDGLAQHELLVELAKIASPDFQPPRSLSTLRKNTSLYRCCEDNGGAYFNDVFFSKRISELFNARMKNAYADAHCQMRALVQRFIAPSKSEWLVRALCETISLDSGTSAWTFNFGNVSYNKTQVISLSNYCLASLLLAVWHNIISNPRDNVEGHGTFTKWHKRKGEEKSEWIFDHSLELGSTITHEFTLALIKQDNASQAQKARLPCDKTVSDVRLFNRYVKGAYQKLSKVRSLLHDIHPIEFNDFHVCNVLSAVSRHKWAKKPEVLQTFACGNQKRDAPCTEQCTGSTLRAIVENYSYAIITAVGGLGKSMLLRRLFLCACIEFDDLRILPAYVQLKHFVEAKQSLDDYLHTLMARHDNSLTKEHLLAALEQGRCLILLDGWNEVRQAKRTAVFAEVGLLIDKYPQNYVYMTSRPDDGLMQYEQFHMLELQPFTKEQALLMINKLASIAEDATVIRDFEALLSEHLFETHKEFAENPFLLTLMLITFEQYGNIPNQMHLFYEDVFNALVRRHDASSPHEWTWKTPYPRDEFKSLFAKICFMAYRDEHISFTAGRFKEYYKLFATRKDVSADDFLNDLSVNLCILMHEGHDYHLIHPSYLEYFAAVCVSELNEDSVRKLGSFIEQTYDRMKRDNMLVMLYDMKPALVEAALFAPFLEDLFAKCDAGNGYLGFVSLMYPNFVYMRGRTNEPYYNEADRKLFEFIKEKLRTSYTLTFDDLPNCNRFLYEVYLDVETSEGEVITIAEEDWHDIIKSGNMNVKNPDGGGTKILLLYDTAKHVGSSYAANFDEAHANKDEMSEFFEVMENDCFLLKAEYHAAREYLAEILEHTKRAADVLGVLVAK